jgi:hypothetical protein
MSRVHHYNGKSDRASRNHLCYCLTCKPFLSVFVTHRTIAVSALMNIMVVDLSGLKVNSHISDWSLGLSLAVSITVSLVFKFSLPLVGGSWSREHKRKQCTSRPILERNSVLISSAGPEKDGACVCARSLLASSMLLPITLVAMDLATINSIILLIFSISAVDLYAVTESHIL